MHFIVMTHNANENMDIFRSIVPLSHSLEIEGNFSSDISESGVLLPLRSLYVSLWQIEIVTVINLINGVYT